MIWYLTTEQLFLSFAFICTFTYVAGWVSDRIMGYAGFGTIGNWLILLVGTYVGMYSFNSFGHMFHWNPPLTIAVVAGTACTMLVFQIGRAHV